MKGTVIKSTGSWYLVIDGEGRSWECRLRGKIRLDGLRSTNPVAVGDKVVFEQEPGKDTGVIKSIETRNNVIVRKSVNLSKASHIIASNVDLAVIVATIAQPRTSTGFIDRFMVTAEAYHIPVALVFNKCDLYTDDQIGEMAVLMEYYSGIGYTSFGVSAKTGFQIERLRALMQGKTCLFAGHSGVGKSALVNALDPTKDLRIGAISSVHNKGMHTTTFATSLSRGMDSFCAAPPEERTMLEEPAIGTPVREKSMFAGRRYSQSCGCRLPFLSTGMRAGMLASA